MPIRISWLHADLFAVELRTMLLTRYLDKQGRVTLWPAKPAAREEVLDYLASKFEPGQVYREKEVGAILDEWHLWNDRALMRRELVDARRLIRTADGSEYRVAEAQMPGTDAII